MPEFSNGGVWRPGTLINVFVDGWTTASQADNFVARWAAPFPATRVRISAAPLAGAHDGNAQIDAILAFPTVPRVLTAIRTPPRQPTFMNTGQPVLTTLTTETGNQYTAGATFINATAPGGGDVVSLLEPMLASQNDVIRIDMVQFTMLQEPFESGTTYEFTFELFQSDGVTELPIVPIDGQPFHVNFVPNDTRFDFTFVVDGGAEPLYMQGVGAIDTSLTDALRITNLMVDPGSVNLSLTLDVQPGATLPDFAALPLFSVSFSGLSETDFEPLAIGLVPEPATATLALLGAGGLPARRRRRA